MHPNQRNTTHRCRVLVLERMTMVQAETDAPTDNITRFPSATSEPQVSPRDPTSALRSKRYRRARKQGGKRDGRKAVQQSDRDGKSAPGGQAPKGEKQKEIKPSVTVHVALPLAPSTDAPASGWRHGRGITFATLTAALALATVSGGFSITGMTSIFVGAFWAVIGMGIALEAGKLSAVAWLGHQRGTASKPLRAALALLVAVLMGLNAIGCYGFLAKAHIGHQVEGETAIGARAADIEARLAVQAEKVADLTKQIADLDAARTIETPSAGNLRTASAINAQAAALAAAAKLRAADDERRQAKRTSLADKLTVEAKALADLKIEKAKVDGDRKVAEADLGPVRYLATLLGAGDQDVLRWFILVIALLLDPAAVLLLLAATRAGPP
jgi:hypothetical protein